MNKKIHFFPVVFLLAVLVLIAYSNHFQNSFHFDDSHVIQQNINIRSIDLVKFFSDASTFSALPANQSYRPMLTTLFAVFYRLGGGEPLWFHIGAFICHLVLWVLLFFLIRRIFSLAKPGDDVDIISLVSASFFILHTANAETINYISAGSDLLSTMFMMMAIVLYALKPSWRKYGLYLMPAMLAMFCKEVSSVFPLFLLAYILYEHKSLEGVNEPQPKRLRHVLMQITPASIMCLGFVFFYETVIPKTFVPSHFTRLEYVLAQPFALLHYFLSFILPFNLSADTDWETIKNPFDDRVIVGIIFIALFFILAIKTWQKARTRPIALGIWFFFIGVFPPSSGIVVLAEVINDHRMFLPFIGLTIAASWAIVLLINNKKEHYAPKPWLKGAGVVVPLVALLGVHAFGTFQRNKIWHNEESLWHDVTIKNPKNGRGLMNYGLALMARGDTNTALFWFEKALVLTPNYVYLHINTAIALNALGNEDKAESHFKKALAIDPHYYGSYYYYAHFLEKHSRQKEALPLLTRAIELAPGFAESRYLLMRLRASLHDWEGLRLIVKDTLQRSPNDAIAKSFEHIGNSTNSSTEALKLTASNDPTFANYVWLSLAYYQDGEWEKTIEAAKQALRFEKDSVVAYNNICSAHVQLGQKHEAIEACRNALAIDPNFELSKNNLIVAQQIEE